MSDWSQSSRARAAPEVHSPPRAANAACDIARELGGINLVRDALDVLRLREVRCWTELGRGLRDGLRHELGAVTRLALPVPRLRSVPSLVAAPGPHEALRPRRGEGVRRCQVQPVQGGHARLGKLATKARLLAHAEKHYAGRYARLDARFKGALCYIDAYTEPDATATTWKITGIIFLCRDGKRVSVQPWGRAVRATLLSTGGLRNLSSTASV